MGVPGRKPKPTRLKVIEGNRGKRPIKKDEPKPPPAAPTPPSWLGREAKAEWRRVVPELDRLGMISLIDRAALVAYCETWETYVAAVRAARKDGVLVQGERGMVKNPAQQIARDAGAALRSWCEQFGFTPSARGRMSVPGAGNDGDTDDLFD